MPSSQGCRVREWLNEEARSECELQPPVHRRCCASTASAVASWLRRYDLYLYEGSARKSCVATNAGSVYREYVFYIVVRNSASQNQRDQQAKFDLILKQTQTSRQTAAPSTIQFQQSAQRSSVTKY